MPEDFINSLFNTENKAETGPGAQDRARAVGPYVLQINPRNGGEFYGYTSAFQLKQAAAEFAATGQDVNERVDGSKPCRPFIDFDGTGSPDIVLPVVRAAVRDELRAIGSESAEIACFWYKKASKLSAHLIAQDVNLIDGNAIKQFAAGVRARLPSELQSSVDLIGNLKSFGLRVPNCGKGGDMSRALKIDAYDAGNWILQDGEDRQTIGQAAEKPAVIAIPEAQTDLKEFSAKISAEFPCFSSAVPIFVNGKAHIIATVSRVLPGHCSSCDKIHDRKGAYIAAAADGGLFLRCYDAPPGSKCLASHEAKETPTAAVDIYDELQDTETVSGRYNVDVIEDDGESDLFIGSAWGTGKSFHNNKIIRAAIAKNPTARVLIVSARRSLSAQMTADFAAVSYNRIKGILNTDLNPITVWQLDSLKRVRTEEKFDLILLDELTALTSHAYHGDNFNARAGMTSLRILLKNAGRVIVSDNDLTSAQVVAFQTIRTNKKRVVRNTYTPWSEVTATIHETRKTAELAEISLWERLNAEFAKREANTEWNGTVVAMHSRINADRIAIEARKRYGSALVKLYTGETDDFEKARDFADAGKAWAGALVIIYTGTVSVGVSCNIPHFSEVFAFFMSDNASAATSAQMLFRARQIKKITIAFIGAKAHGLPLNKKDLLKWAVLAKNRGELPDEFRHDRNHMINTQSACNSDDLGDVVRGFEGQLWIAAKMEELRSQANFIGRLTNILERAGVSIIKEAIEPIVVPSVVPSSGEEPEEERKKKMVDNAEEAIERMLEDENSENPRNRSEEDRSAEHKAGDRVVHMGKVFGVDALQITAEFIEEHEQKQDKYQRLTRTVNNKAREGWALKTTCEAEGCALAVKVLGALNLTVNADSGTVVTTEQIQAAAEKLAPEINNACLRLYGDRNGKKREKAKPALRSWLAVLNSPLDYIGIELKQTYGSEYDTRQKKNPTGGRLAYAWDSEIVPIIEHPKNRQP